MERYGKTLVCQPFAGAMIYLSISIIFMFINIRLFMNNNGESNRS